MKLYFDTVKIRPNASTPDYLNAEISYRTQIHQAMKIASQIDGGYVHVRIWKKELGADEHLDGFIQISVRPYRQGYGCDGSTDSNIHLIAKTVCNKIGIDYIEAYRVANSAQLDLETSVKWISELELDNRTVSETLIPQEISLDVLRLVLSDLYQINNRSLVEVLEDLMMKNGYPVDDYFLKEDQLKAWKYQD